LVAFLPSQARHLTWITLYKIWKLKSGLGWKLSDSDCVSTFFENNLKLFSSRFKHVSLSWIAEELCCKKLFFISSTKLGLDRKLSDIWLYFYRWLIIHDKRATNELKNSKFDKAPVVKSILFECFSWDIFTLLIQNKCIYRIKYNCKHIFSILC
jgi:hypothetical protein